MIVDLMSCGVAPCAASVWLQALICVYINSTSYTRIHSMCHSYCIWSITLGQRQTFSSVFSSLDLLLSSIIPLFNRFCVGLLFPVSPGLALVLFLLHRVILLLNYFSVVYSPGFHRHLFSFPPCTSYLSLLLFLTLSFMLQKILDSLEILLLTWLNIFFLLLLSPSDTEN